MIENENQADWIRALKSFIEASKKQISYMPPTHVMSPDGTNYKLEDLFKELEKYENKTNKIQKIKSNSK